MMESKTGWNLMNEVNPPEPGFRAVYSIRFWPRFPVDYDLWFWFQ